MASKTAQIIIQVDSKSLAGLKQQIKELETSMSRLAVGTAEWNAQNQKLGTLKTSLQDVTQQAKALQGQIQNVTFDQQIKSVAKLGAGMVGAFSAVSGSLRLIGADSKVFDEMTAKATTLMSIMAGLNQFGETFSKQTLGGLKTISTGFLNLVKTVKAASTAMKVAIASTGIGLLIIAIAALIANWKKIIDLFKGSSKEAQKLVDQTKKASELTSEQVKSQKILVEEQYKLNEGKGKEIALAEKTLALGILNTKELDAQIKAQEAIVAQLELQLSQINTIFNIGEKKKRKAKQDEIDQAKAVQATLEAEKLVQEIETERNKVNLEITKKVQAQTIILNKLERELALINTKAYSTQEAYEKQQQILERQVQTIEAQRDGQGKLTFELEQQRLSYLNQLEVNKKINEEFQRQLDINIKLLEFQLKYNKLTNDYYTAIRKIYQQREGLNAFDEQTKEHQLRNVKLVDLLNEGYKETVDIYQELTNFDYRRNKLLEERTVWLSEEISVSKELYGSIKAYIENVKNLGLTLNKDFTFFVDNMFDLSSALNQISNEYKDFLTEKINEDKQVLGIFEKISKNGERMIKNAASELTLKKLLTATTIDRLEKEKKSINTNLFFTQKLIKDYETIKSNLESEKNALIESHKVDKERFDFLSKKTNISKKEKEEYLDLLQKELDYDSSLNAIKQKDLDLEGSINDEIITRTGYEEKTIQINTEIAQTKEDLVNTESRITYELKEQFKLINLLKNGIERYRDEIMAVSDIINQSMELMAVQQEQIAINQQKNIDKALENQEKLIESTDEYIKQIEDLNEIQKDANGDRYDEIEARRKLLEQEVNDKRIAWQGEEQARVNAVNAKNKAEEKAAKWRKAQSIIDATIQTALAVVEALPNVFLSAAVGILGALQVATISAQKVSPAEIETAQPVPFKEGGYTGFGDETEPAGIVHHKEYVVPAKVVRSPQAKYHIESLEKQRLRGYQEGGFTLPANMNSFNTTVDYEKLAVSLADAISKLPNPQVALVSISNGLRDVNLTKQNAGLVR
jgi:hypothetical protein